MEETRLQIDLAENLFCLDNPEPEFTWTLPGEERGLRQKHYALTLKTGEKTLWTTGEVVSERLRRRYDGPALEPETLYRLSLNIKDSLDRETHTEREFRTGLMDDSFSSPRWAGAKWIGTDTRSLRAEATSVFRLSCEITIPAGSGSAALILGANDPRLMDRDKNLYGLENLRFRSYIRLELNLSACEQSGEGKMEIYRVGYAPTDSREAPFAVLPIPGNLVNRENCHAPHTLSLAAEYGEFDFYLDGVLINPLPEHPSPFDSGRVNLNPVGRGGDYTCFPNLCSIGCRLKAGEEAIFKNLTVKNYRTPCRTLFVCWEEGFRLSGGEKGSFRIFDPSNTGIPMLRAEFGAEKEIDRAFLTVTARGVFEGYLNGEKIGEEWLSPGLTQYNMSHSYVTHDVTSLLHRGENALCFLLGEGWWSGMISFTGSNTNFWGDCQSLLCKLTILYRDGEKKEIVSSPESFTACSEGPIRSASIFQGQVYDAWYEKNIEGWLQPGFGGAWPPAKEIVLSIENTAMGTLPGPRGQTLELNYDKIRALGRTDGGVRMAGHLTALSRTEVHPGVFVYDFGRNIAGIPDVTLPAGLPGQEIVFRYAELLYPLLPEYGDNQGMLMVENLRGALVTDLVYLGEKEIHFCPQFTFHGFRYMEITGLDEPLPCEAVHAVALSSIPTLSADYRCSDMDVNRLFENITWSFRDNFLSIPTDCPQRNERMGWSGDLSVFSRTAVRLGACDAFLRRHMRAMEDGQHEDGRFPDIAPVCDGFGGILWGSAGMTVPWEMYMQYGDVHVLEEHYPAMEKYIRFLLQHVDDETGLQTAGELGDWLGPQKGKTENALLWMCYFVYDLKIMADTAALLGKAEAESYAMLYEMTKARLNEVYFDPESHKTVYSCEEAAHGNRMPFEPIREDEPLPPKEPCGGYRMDTQTSYCVPLALGLVSDEHRGEAITHLSHVCEDPQLDDDGIVRPAHSLMTGFIGTAWLLPALSMGERDDTAYGVLLSREYPSWLYPVTQGATSIWERLDSYTSEKGFGGHNSMNSFNHYSFGAVGAWLLGRSLGISPEEPGYRVFNLSPTPDEEGRITSASGYMDTVSGRIESAWEYTEKGTRYTIRVPAGTECLFSIKANPYKTVTESGKRPEEAEGVTPLGHDGKRLRFYLEAGSYVFEVR